MNADTTKLLGIRFWELVDNTIFPQSRGKSVLPKK